jgi:hypothetical protein
MISTALDNIPTPPSSRLLGAGTCSTVGPAVFTMTDGKLYTATITMTVNFLAPAKPGPITGEAIPAPIAATANSGSRVLLSRGHHQRCGRHGAPASSVRNERTLAK